MSYKVHFFPESKTVSINGTVYTQDDLKSSSLSRVETAIAKTLDIIIKEYEDKKLQRELDFEDKEAIVFSDLFKGDSHSLGLIN